MNAQNPTKPHQVILMGTDRTQRLSKSKLRECVDSAPPVPDVLRATYSHEPGKVQRDKATHISITLQ